MIAFVHGRVTVRKSRSPFAKPLEVRPLDGEPFSL